MEVYLGAPLIGYVDSSEKAFSTWYVKLQLPCINLIYEVAIEHKSSAKKNMM